MNNRYSTAAKCILLELLLTLRGSQEQKTEQRPQEASTSSWYSPFVASSPSSSQLTTHNSCNNSNSITQRPGDQVNALARVSPAIIVDLQDKR